MDPIYYSQMQDLLKSPDFRPKKEREWQQLGIMLPILRQNHTTNVIRNDQWDVDPDAEIQSRARATLNTLHTPACLTSPSITLQSRKAVSTYPVIYEEDTY